MSKISQCFVMAALAAALIWDPAHTMVSGAHDGFLDCGSGYREFDPLVHKPVYTIGVHAPGGNETAWREFNMTFQDYLTATAGKRFQPNIEFRMKATGAPISDWVDHADENDVDFYFSDTGVYSCIGVEVGAQPVATTVSRMEARGRYYDLDVFAGVIFARADNHDVDSVDDIVNKVIGAVSISDFAGGQVQMYVMNEAGMDYIMDPKQVIFTDNQYDVITGVMNGDWDVGFVRTGLIEKTRDEAGEFIDAELFKILEPRVYVLNDGSLFPFLHSTPSFPEWPIAASVDVPADVAEEVHDALVKLGQYKLVGERMKECERELCNLGNCGSNGTQICNTAPIQFFDEDAPCETTRELAELAYKAGIAGHHEGFRSPMSYFEIRTMQQAAGFLLQDERGGWECIRAETLYDGVICPEGHYKLSRELFDTACDDIGLPCPDKEGYNCYCKPCVKAFEVDVYEYKTSGDGAVHELDQDDQGCTKMSLCANVQQTKRVTFRVRDNVQREGATVSAQMHMDESSTNLVVVEVPNESFMYEFSFSELAMGVGILEVFVNGEQIPESPFRVQVVERDCEMDYPGKGKSATEAGTCMCGSGTIEFGDECMNSSIFAIVISSVLVAIFMELGYLYLRYKRRKSDEMWQVSIEELHFTEPVEVVGQGSFGVVLLAEYRGTKVAIKRALPPATRGSKSGSKGGLASGSIDKPSKGLSSMGSMDGPIDIEAQAPTEGKKMRGSVDVRGSVEARGSKDVYSGSRFSTGSRSSEGNLSFLCADDFEISRQKGLAKWCPGFGMSEHARLKSSILGETTRASSVSNLSLKALCCPWFDKQSRQKEEFLEEMRLLSRLRHPCITTVMGAVISGGHDPMLVMEYMEYGSLYDLLRSETMFFSGEICLQILRDVAQGLRYLHGAKPPILHGDLKAKNILIDSRFRAKVCDFGLSTKKKHGISGTPFWLAPEYLRGKTEYNTTCDMYSVGIIIYELYARKDPYDGEKYKKVLRNVCDPRKNHRPAIPECCPPKIVTMMKNLWSPDPFHRPQAKDLDMSLMDMSMGDAEPLVEGDIQAGTKTTTDMLYELFPKHIADKLKEGQKCEPEQHDLVTVVFAEVYGFHDIARKLTPTKIQHLLNKVFSKLDTLAKEHSIFKVETVGECYMGVTNLEGKMAENHVKNVALFALGAIDAVKDCLVDEENPKHGHIHIRVGFHSGPVVTNVIGSLNPRFGLFGDTVNTASRMESNAFANRIQCSEKSALILKEQDPGILILKRGKVPIKGKGEMMTYWIGDGALSSKQDKSLMSDHLASTGSQASQCSIESMNTGSNVGLDSGILRKKKAPEAPK